MSLDNLLVELARVFVQSNIVAVSVAEGTFVGPRTRLHHLLVMEGIIAAQVVQILLNLPSHRI